MDYNAIGSTGVVGPFVIGPTVSVGPPKRLRTACRLTTKQMADADLCNNTAEACIHDRTPYLEHSLKQENLLSVCKKVSEEKLHQQGNIGIHPSRMTLP